MAFIALFGDRHGRIDEHFQQALDYATQDDYIIVLGDFGFIWTFGWNNSYAIKQMSETKGTLLFLDGNHENFDQLESLPTQDFCGGEVGVVRDNILHLKRGQIYTIGGKTFFTLGGAETYEPFVEVIRKNDPDREVRVSENYQMGGMCRIEGLSWWSQEMPNAKEVFFARRNLVEPVNYILTHTPPRSVMPLLGIPNKSAMKNNDFYNFLEELKDSNLYDHWYFGHMHVDQKVDDRFTALFEKPIVIEI